MAARAGMAALITSTRLLIYDPAGGSQVFSDDEIEDALDRHRLDVRLLPLTEAQTIQVGGAIVFLDYYAPYGDWEADAVLQSGSTWATLTPTTSDYVTGHWTFAADQLPPVFLTGKSFDRYAAAVELLEDWIARLKMEYSFSTNEQRFNRKERIEALDLLIDRYSARRRPVTVQLHRDDVR